MESNFAFNWSFSLCLHFLHCHLSHVHIFPKRGFFFVGRFKDLALDLIVREKVKQIRFSMRDWHLWLIEKVTKPIKIFFKRKTNPQTNRNNGFQYYIIVRTIFFESFVHPSQMMWWCVTILSAACLATCLSSFSWGRSVQSLPLQQETTFSNLISKNVLGKSEQKWYQNEGRGWFLWVFAWLGDCAFPIKRCNVTFKPIASVTLFIMFLTQH